SKFGELTLRRTLVQPRRPNRGSRPLFRTLKRTTDGSWLFRWDTLFLVPATPDSAESIESLQLYLQGVQSTKVRFINTADTLIVDNHRMMQGRSSVSPESSRYVERV